ncbi:unnamed protein product, partial [Linum tenue]
MANDGRAEVVMSIISGENSQMPDEAAVDDDYGSGDEPFFLSLNPLVVNPHAENVQRLKKFFVVSCLLAIFLDPLFFFLLAVNQVRTSDSSPPIIILAYSQST